MMGILSLMMKLCGKKAAALVPFYDKTSQSMETAKELRSFHITVQGYGHIRNGKECQDASDHAEMNHACICAVCDGHGGDDYVRSAAGSRIACETAIENIKAFLDVVNKEELHRYPDQVLSNLEASIISSWNEKIRIDYEAHPLTGEELAVLSESAKKKYLDENRFEGLYGTTMIAAAFMEECWIGIQIGDGKCVAIDDGGSFFQPIPWDERCFLNETTSICDAEALQNFRHVYSERLPAAVLLGSDGVDDCFYNDEQLYDFYKTILCSFAGNTFDSVVRELEDYLPRLSAKGSADDISLASILRINKLVELPFVDEFNTKMRVQKERRQQEIRTHVDS